MADCVALTQAVAPKELAKENVADLRTLVE